MRVILDGGAVIQLGTVETKPTIGIIDYSRRVTDDYGVTTVVERGFARRMSVKLAVPSDQVDAIERRLVDLRTKPALWIADDGLVSLQVRGFYKEFILDLAVPPLSYCTLTIEGLTDDATLPDAGGDPAPEGRTSSLKLVQPIAVAGGMLTASTIAEADYAEWSAGATYPLGARVIRTAKHRIYESAIGGNVGNDPAAAGATKWIDIAPTNRWAMFDQALGSLSTGADLIEVTIAPGAAVDAVALLDVTAATVRVRADGYDQTVVPTGSALFLDLPGSTGNVTVTVHGSGAVSVGTLLIGRTVRLGLTEASPSAGITDFSRKTTDDFGAVTVVERAWAKRMTARSLIRTDRVDTVMGRIAAVRARPSLWIGQDVYDSLTIYGFFKDFSIEVGENVSTLSLSVEGLSTAAPVKSLVASADWADLTDKTGTKPANNATNSADPNSPFGPDGKTFGQVKKTLDDFDAAIAAITDRTGAIDRDFANIDNALVTIGQKARQGSPNLLKNPDFSDGLKGWSTPPQLAPWTTGDDPTVGSIAFSTTGGDSYIEQRVIGYPNQPYGLSFEAARDSAGVDGFAQLIFLNQNSLEITPAGRSAEVRVWQWGRAGTTVVSPPGTSSVLVRVARSGSAAALAFTRIQFQYGPPTDWRNDKGVAVTRERTDGIELALTELEGEGAASVRGRVNSAIALAAGDQGIIGSRIQAIEVEFDPGRPSSTVARIGTAEQAAADAITAVTKVERASASSIGLFPMSTNANMGLFPDGAIRPSGWVQWQAAGESFRGAPGRLSPYYFEHVNNENGQAGVDAGLFQNPGLAPGLAGQGTVWIVAEAVVTYVDGDDASGLKGSGLYFNTIDGVAPVFLDFGRTVPQGFDAVPGSYVKGGTYTYARMVKADTRNGLNFYLMTQWAGFDFPARGRRLRWHYAGLRQATAQEIVAGKADTNASAALARIEVVEGTQVRAGEVVAGLKTSIDASLRSGAPNLVQNPGFDDGLNGWVNHLGGWRHIPESFRGSFAECPGSNADDYLYQDVRVSQGVSYSVGLEADPDNGPADGRLLLAWLPEDRAQQIGTSVEVNSDNWIRATSGASPFLPPPGATWARIHLHKLASAGTYRGSRVMLQEGAPTVYSPGRVAGLLRVGIVDAARAYIDPLKATADRVASVEAQFDPGNGASLKARVEQVSGAVAGKQDLLQATWGVRATAGDQEAHLGIDVRNGSGGTYARIILDAPEILMHGNVLIQDSVGTRALADFAVNGLFSVTCPYVEVGTGDTLVLLLTVTSTGKPLLIQVGGSSSSNETNSLVALYRDGSPDIIVTTVAERRSSIAMVTRVDLPAGQYTFRLIANATVAGGGINNPAIIVQEVKK